MINYAPFNQATLVKKPFKYAIICSPFDTDRCEGLLQELPSKNNYRSVRSKGSDKTYNVVNNLLLKLGDSDYNRDSNLSKNWIGVVRELQSDSYIRALSCLLETPLTDCFQEITLKRYGYQDYISLHTDKEPVRATHMIFLNKIWKPEWGGQLCFYDENQVCFSRFIPTLDLSVAFVRSNNSWHSVEEILEPSVERIAIQVAFWNKTDRTVLPGRLEKTVSV